MQTVLFSLLPLSNCLVSYSYVNPPPPLLMDDDPVLRPEMIASVNSLPSIGWTAGVNSIFVGKTISNIRSMIGTTFPDTKWTMPESGLQSSDDLPKEFDVYTHWPNCVHPIRNQGQCGSDWAFSVTGAMSDRFCAAGENVILSPQDLVSCEKDQYACQGAYFTRTWEFMEETGIVSESCFPAPFLLVAPWKTYKVKSGTTDHSNSLDAAMTAILTYGSIQSSHDLYQDFFSYKSGVYQHTWGSLAGNHAIKIQGWGQDVNGTKYWNIANTWGDSWGMKGYYWILRGVDECGIADTMYGGVPDV